ncbi:hypothetical protein G5714_006110 [Onychostoma macrolepis]|uniref:Mitochondrial import receptor subunit TOM40B n=2 Tax=Onychostoma macrolepis TaxID=369639 RepID=A0A7J6D2Y1_9TELE|nr:hypothetical protein G5714_006110 [Onychostoma macrolepis]
MLIIQRSEYVLFPTVIQLQKIRSSHLACGFPWAVCWPCQPAQGAKTPLFHKIDPCHGGIGEMDGYLTLGALTVCIATVKQIEGVKMVINKTLSSFFKVSHTFHLSAVAPSSYRFHAEHLQSDTDSKETGSPMLIGEMDSSGSLNAHSLFHLSEKIRAKAVFQTQQAQFVTWQFETEYRGSDFTAAVTMANPDILRESVIMVAHFLQSVSPQLVLGGELVYHRGRAEEGGILTLAGQYSGPNWVATLNAGKGGAHASYYHRANKQIQVGVEFEASTRTQETTFSFGYQMELPESKMVFKGMLDSRCIIGGVLEKRLYPLPATLIMGAFVNHRADKLQVGLGVNVG